MFKNYFKIIFRNIWKNKFYAFINIFGLAVGITASTLIALYVEDELSYDMHNEHADRVYRVTTTMDFNGPMDVAVTNMALAPTLKKDYPEVEAYARFFGGRGELELTANDQVFNESNFWFTDSLVFDVFTYDFIAGDEETALDGPNSIVLIKSMAQKLYGGIDCVGQELKMNNSFLTVKGVVEDPPGNSEIPVNALVSISTLPERMRNEYYQDWFRIGFYTFLLMNEPIEAGAFDAKLDEVNETYVLPWAEANGVKASHDYALTPLKDVHFDNSRDYDMPKGDMSNIYMFGALALFLLLIAAFNYINLTLGTAAQERERSRNQKDIRCFKKIVDRTVFRRVAVLYICSYPFRIGIYRVVHGQL